MPASNDKNPTTEVYLVFSPFNIFQVKQFMIQRQMDPLYRIESIEKSIA